RQRCSTPSGGASGRAATRSLPASAWVSTFHAKCYWRTVVVSRSGPAWTRGPPSGSPCPYGDPMTHKVLVVEDEQELREMMRDALELNGYSVITADDGQDALAKLTAIAGTDHLCLVLLDLLLPGMNGWEVFEKLRERPELASVPVIVHSSVSKRAP